ncbi:Pyruvate dehydrogenase e1 component subunit alpha [Legionella pneumophila]|nr:Pyruvate dehydrogenase e1 component subunit alpha [Legionella pneumophila]
MTTVAQFEITYTQYLNEQGKLVAELPPFADNQSILKELYKIMVLTRTFDKKAIALQRTGKNGNLCAN